MKKQSNPKAFEAPLLLYLIKQVQMKASLRLGAALEPYGVTAVQFRVLAEIDQRSHLSSAEISRLFDVRPQTMNKQIAQLEGRGLITRAASSENRRILEMSLTASGRRTLKACSAEAQKLEKELFQRLSVRQKTDFRAVLNQILRGLD